MKRILLAALILSSFSCTKDAAAPAAKPGEAPAAKAPEKPAEKPVVVVKVEMKNLKPTIDPKWEGTFNPALEDWTFEKYTPGKDGTNEPNRFYLSKFPDDRPKEVEAYAKALQTDQNFQDMGSLFTAVASKEKLPAGWLILGTQKAMGDAEDKGAPAFVLYRADLEVYCRGSVFKSEALRAEAVEACKTLKP
jgi:hypothetical protein